MVINSQIRIDYFLATNSDLTVGIKISFETSVLFYSVITEQMQMNDYRRMNKEITFQLLS